MEEQREGEFITFSNLIQASPDIAGDSHPVKARKESIRENKYAQENAVGEPYRPRDLGEVKERAIRAAERFNALFAGAKAES